MSKKRMGHGSLQVGSDGKLRKPGQTTFRLGGTPGAKKKKHQDRPEDGSSRLEANEHNRLPQPLRGVANFLNEERAASQEDYKKLKELKKNPKY